MNDWYTDFLSSWVKKKKSKTKMTANASILWKDQDMQKVEKNAFFNSAVQFANYEAIKSVSFCLPSIMAATEN